MDHILFIHPSIAGHLSCFHLLAITNNDAVNVDIHTSLQDPAANSLECMPRGGIAGSYGISIPNFVRSH